MRIPLFSLNACSFNELQHHTKIFNISTIEYFLWIRLPIHQIRDCELFQVDECQPKKRELCWLNFIERDHQKPWLRITFGILSKDVGMHIYKLSFINKYTNDVVPVYFSYIIQNDNPEKSYIYMRDEECEVV